MRDRPVAGPSLLKKHNIHMREGEPFPRRDSNPQSQHANGRRPTPQTVIYFTIKMAGWKVDRRTTKYQQNFQLRHILYPNLDSAIRSLFVLQFSPALTFIYCEVFLVTTFGRRLDWITTAWAVTVRRYPAAAGTRATPNLIERLTKHGGKVIGAFQKSKCSQI